MSLEESSPPPRALTALRALPRMGWCEPTPLVERSVVDPLTGRSFGVLLKRDGVLQGPGGALYGGNKLRKLDYLLPPLLAQGVGALCTVGGEGSHHVLATVCAARWLGLESHVALTAQPHSSHSLAVCGLIERWATSVVRFGADDPALLSESLARWREGRGGWIPTGGSCVEGVFGMVVGALELCEQLGAVGGVERIYIAAASGSSLAGLLLGLSLGRALGLISGPLPLVVGVRVTPSRLVSGRKVRRLYWGAAERLGWEGAPPLFVLDDGLLGGGYGCSGPLSGAVEGGELGLGVGLDRSYTAKAFGALLVGARGGVFERAVFWHTLDERGVSGSSAGHALSALTYFG